MSLPHLLTKIISETRKLATRSKSPEIGQLDVIS
jgi:hypothetical protein